MANKIVEIKVKNDSDGYDNLIVSRARQAEYASEDHSKGTIEERLTNLGRQSIEVPLSDEYGAISYGVCRCEKTGRFVYVDIELELNTSNMQSISSLIGSETEVVLGSIPTEYAPRNRATVGNIIVNSKITYTDSRIPSYIAFYETQSFLLRINFDGLGNIHTVPCSSVLEYATITEIEESSFRTSGTFDTLG